MVHGDENKVAGLSANGIFNKRPDTNHSKKYFNLESYREYCRDALDDFEGFWAERAEELVSWSRKWDEVLRYDFSKPEVSWFVGGKLNGSYNCLDRHLNGGNRNKAALIWQGEEDDEVKVFTYQMLYSEVCKFANVLRKKGVKKGDTVSIYLPMVPELVIAMLACARVGAVHSVIFAGFSAASLQKRIVQCGSRVLITADAVVRGGRAIPLKSNADEVLEECSSVTTCIVVKRTNKETSMNLSRDSWWNDEIGADDISNECEPEEMESGDNLFVLYTSGATGEPKGIVHSIGGYLTHAMHTCSQVFDINRDDVYWCTADVGWITGHSYVVYGPLGIGATVLMYEGTPLYPRPNRFWQIIEKFKVTIFYTAPTAIRALMYFKTDFIKKHDLSSLRILGSVGEPINIDAWEWYRNHAGGGVLPVVDTWCQTETGGIMISPIPGITPLKPGSAALPLSGVDMAILDEQGDEVAPGEIGRLVILRPWPGMLHDVLGDGNLFKEGYFATYPGVYDTGDSAHLDEDGFYWIRGRLDDVINVSGCRLGTAEIETALITHPSVAEAAVVGMPHPVKGEAVYAFVTVHRDVVQTLELLDELRIQVREAIGLEAFPDVIQYAVSLPKTRSGKVMRRVLRKVAAGEFDNFGDTSSLADPSTIDDLIEGKKQFVPEN